jgi:hypothetical protein
MKRRQTERTAALRAAWRLLLARYGAAMTVYELGRQRSLVQ